MLCVKLQNILKTVRVDVRTDIHIGFYSYFRLYRSLSLNDAFIRFRGIIRVASIGKTFYRNGRKNRLMNIQLKFNCSVNPWILPHWVCFGSVGE